jgi:FkbM family methyltransferase
MPRNKNWKWKLRVFIYKLRIWPILSVFRLVRQYLKKQPHEPEFGILAHPGFQARRGLFLDIGANAGQSIVSALIFNNNLTVVAFEPNREHAAELRWIRFLFGLRRVRLQFLGAGETAGSQKIFIPTVQGVPLTQEATLVRRNLLEDPTTLDRVFALTGSKEFSIQEQVVFVEALDRFQFAPDFVKIDVQLSELEVLKGMEQTLAKYKPVLMIENGPLFSQIVRYLENFGYSAYRYEPSTKKLESVSSPFGFMNGIFVAEGGNFQRWR